MIHRILVVAALLALVASTPAQSMVDEGCSTAQSCGAPAASDDATAPVPHSYWIGGRSVELTEEQVAREQRCLALVAYGEARGEGRKGMLAIMFVVMNRIRAAAETTPAARPAKKQAEKDLLPCDVIARKHAFEALHSRRFHRALLSIRGGHAPLLPAHPDPAEAARLELANSLAREMIEGKLNDDVTGGATHFYCPSEQRHMRRGKPEWTTKLVATAWIGKQVFYR